MDAAKLALNVILIGATGYAAVAVTLARPYAFVACTFACCHALLTLIQAVKCEEPSKIKNLSDGIMEILPLSLINIELYNDSGSKDYAPAHWFFIIPLVFDLIAKLCTEDGEDCPTATLKDLTIIGNIVSACYLAFSEGNFNFYALAGLVLFIKYGYLVMNLIKECAHAYAALLCEASFYIVLGLLLSGDGGGGGGGGE